MMSLKFHRENSFCNPLFLPLQTQKVIRRSLKIQRKLNLSKFETAFAYLFPISLSSHLMNIFVWFHSETERERERNM